MSSENPKPDNRTGLQDAFTLNISRLDVPSEEEKKAESAFTLDLPKAGSRAKAPAAAPAFSSSEATEKAESTPAGEETPPPSDTGTPPAAPPPFTGGEEDDDLSGGGPKRRIPVLLIVIILIAAAAAGYLFACGNIRKKAAAIVVTPGPEVVLRAGESTEYTYTLSPADAKVSISAGSDIISLEGRTVTALRHGKSTIVFMPVIPSWARPGVELLGGVDGTALSVTIFTDYTVTVKPEAVTLEPGMTNTLNVSIVPEEKDVLFHYASTDEEVAEVSRSGIITAKSTGSADITVTVILPGQETTLTIPVTVNPHEHDFKEAERVEATCLAEGSVRYVCACGEEHTETLPIGDHSWTDTLRQDATCTEGGHVIRTCSVCGLTEEETTEPLGHDWRIASESEATCTQPGHTDYICNRCSETREEVTPGLGHDWYEVSRIEPTCEEEGFSETRCARCGQTSSTRLSAYGHDMQVISRTEPTCTEAGAVLYQCTRCGELVPDTIDPLGHEYQMGEDGVSRCIRCGQAASP